MDINTPPARYGVSHTCVGASSQSERKHACRTAASHGPQHYPHSGTRASLPSLTITSSPPKHSPPSTCSSLVPTTVLSTPGATRQWSNNNNIQQPNSLPKPGSIAGEPHQPNETQRRTISRQPSRTGLYQTETWCRRRTLALARAVATGASTAVCQNIFHPQPPQAAGASKKTNDATTETGRD